MSANKSELLRQEAIKAVKNQLGERGERYGNIGEALCNFVDMWEIYNSSIWTYEKLTIELFALLSNPAVSKLLPEWTHDKMGAFLSKLADFLKDLQEEGHTITEIELMLLENWPEDKAIEYVIEKYQPKGPTKGKEIAPGLYTLILKDGSVLRYYVEGLNDTKDGLKGREEELETIPLSSIQEMYQVKNSVIKA